MGGDEAAVAKSSDGGAAAGSIQPLASLPPLVARARWWTRR